MQTREKHTVKRNDNAVLGQGSGSPSMDIHNNILEVFCRYRNLLYVWEVNDWWCYAVHKHAEPTPGGCWMLMMLTSTFLTTNRSEECPQLVTPFLSHYYKTSHYTLQVGTHSFESISLLWPSLPGKEIKLFFSTLAKTLSPRFNSVLEYRGWIWLQVGAQCGANLGMAPGVSSS